MEGWGSLEIDPAHPAPPLPGSHSTHNNTWLAVATGDATSRGAHGLTYRILFGLRPMAKRVDVHFLKIPRRTQT